MHVLNLLRKAVMYRIPNIVVPKFPDCYLDFILIFVILKMMIVCVSSEKINILKVQNVTKMHCKSTKVKQLLGAFCKWEDGIP